MPRNVYIGMLLAGSFLHAQHLDRVDRSWQRTFSAMDIGVKVPISIPKDIMEYLRKDETVLPVLNSEAIRAEKLPSTWFSSSVVRLGKAGEADILVKGEYPIEGANTTSFWIFIPTRRGHQLVLTTTGLNLTVQRARDNGYMNIQAAAVIAGHTETLLYKFDGQKYKLARQAAEPIQ